MARMTEWWATFELQGPELAFVIVGAALAIYVVTLTIKEWRDR